MKSVTVLLTLSSFLLVADCDPIPGLMDFFKSSDAIVPDKTDLELIDHIALANGPTTTDLPLNVSESTSTEPSSSESSKKDSEIKSSDLFGTSSTSSTSEQPSSTEESSSEADHVQSDHHESSDATTTFPTTTVLPTTTVISTTNRDLSEQEPLATIPSSETGSSSDSSQSSSEANGPWDVSSEDPAVNEIGGDMDKKEHDQTNPDWMDSFFGTDRQQEDFNNFINQIDPTEANSTPSSTSEQTVDKKIRDEMPMNDQKSKDDSPRINVAGHGSNSTSVPKGFCLFSLLPSILFLLIITH